MNEPKTDNNRYSEESPGSPRRPEKAQFHHCASQEMELKILMIYPGEVELLYSLHRRKRSVVCALLSSEPCLDNAGGAQEYAKQFPRY